MATSITKCGLKTIAKKDERVGDPEGYSTSPKTEKAKRIYTKRGTRTWDTAREWLEGMNKCKAVRWMVVDSKTRVAVCDKTGGKCNYACCPRVKKNQ
jgi:hypothetical protein